MFTSHLITSKTPPQLERGGFNSHKKHLKRDRITMHRMLLKNNQELTINCIRSLLDCIFLSPTGHPTPELSPDTKEA